MDEFETRQPKAEKEENRRLKRLVADKYLSFPKLKVSTERVLGNPILPTRFPAIRGPIGREMLEIGGDRLSPRAIK